MRPGWFERLLLRIIFWGLLFLVFVPFDGLIYRHIRTDNLPLLEERDWYKLLRVVGSVWTWLAVSGVLLTYDLAAHGRAFERSLRRVTLIMLSTISAGLIAEMFKILTGRLRPSVDNGRYLFRPLAEALRDQSNLGLPSSHSAVAFAGVCAVMLLHRPTAPVMLALGAGCALMRVYSGAHFMTDAVAGAAVGYAAAWAWRTLDLRNERRRAAREDETA